MLCSVTEDGNNACRVTRFNKDDAPNFSRFEQGRNEPHSSKYNAYDSRPDMQNSRDAHRQSDTSESGFSAVRERVQMGIATSHSHTEALQDMVLNLSEGTNRRDAESDKTVLKDLVKEMLTFRYNACNLCLEPHTCTLACDGTCNISLYAAVCHAEPRNASCKHAWSRRITTRAACFQRIKHVD